MFLPGLKIFFWRYWRSKLWFIKEFKLCIRWFHNFGCVILSGWKVIVHAWCVFARKKSGFWTLTKQKGMFMVEMWCPHTIDFCSNKEHFIVLCFFSKGPHFFYLIQKMPVPPYTILAIGPLYCEMNFLIFRAQMMRPSFAITQTPNNSLSDR